ncbi:conserved hypothetical protein [Trichinella spiralis]|uniref:hypothetical protein n=1 Tax=Trichinella spiralis TaxID=6334 RepID=UPI0001EFDAFD|nr:conserved hypothetical protein [Trichinella spiralis]
MKLCDISFETIRHILIKAERFQEFLFGLQNIVNIKDTLVDCSDVAHPTLEKHVFNVNIWKSIEQEIDISYFMIYICVVKSILAEKFNKVYVINLLIFFYLEVQGLT